MLRTLSSTYSSTILQSINVVDEDEVGESGGNETNLSNLSTLIRFTRGGYSTSGGAKKGGNNTKKDVEAARNFDYLIPATKKAFNHLWHAIIQAPIF